MPKRFRRPGPLTAAGLAIIIHGGLSCGSSTPPVELAPSVQQAGEDVVIVMVTNNTLARLRVHARYGERDPLVLGIISTHRTRAFPVPWNAGQLKMGVRRADATEPTPRWSQTGLTVSPGDSLEFILTTSDRRTAQIVFRKLGEP